jgi:hypothetical protein
MLFIYCRHLSLLQSVSKSAKYLVKKNFIWSRYSCWDCFWLLHVFCRLFSIHGLIGIGSAFFFIAIPEIKGALEDYCERLGENSNTLVGLMGSMGSIGYVLGPIILEPSPHSSEVRKPLALSVGVWQQPASFFSLSPPGKFAFLNRQSAKSNKLYSHYRQFFFGPGNTGINPPAPVIIAHMFIPLLKQQTRLAWLPWALWTVRA